MPEINPERAAEERTVLHGVLPAGSMLRGYELKAILGQGGFGITYRARDTNLHRDVAIKEYLPTSLALREGRTTVVPRSADHAEQFAWGRERFLDEARTLARLDKTPAIVRVYDFLEANGTAYMVMALVEGETLLKRLTREQRLLPETIERVLYPLLDGLEEFHASGFLHRDIKPANIMVDAAGKPTLIDFGASRAAMADRSATLTAIFTPGYAAAEQFTSAKLGPWTDIYGLSATLYHAITGRTPPSAIERILNDTYEPLGTLQPEGFPASLLAGIDAGLALRVIDRPANIGEWREMLRPETGSSGEATHVARRPGPLARAARRSRSAGVTIKGPALWGALAAAILALAGGGYLAFVAERPGAASLAAQNLTAEQLELALAERRKADSLAAEKRQLEEEAQRRAETEAAAKRQADAELETARQARQKAEEELAQVKADIAARRQTETGQRDQAEAAIRRVVEEEAQRRAEDETAALRQAEDEARKKAETEAEAKRQADEALARAQAERQRADEEARLRAEAEATKRRADEEARLKVEAETAKRRGDEEARLKAEAEMARRKADEEARLKAEAETAKRRSDEDARRKAEAATKEKGEAELAAQRKTAEAGETALRLDLADRQRLQVALSSRGFDTRGSDGVLGPRSREMIAAWQRARNASATGFLSAPEQQALLKEAAAAVTKFDEEQRKAEDEKTEARLRAAAAAAAPAAAAPTPGTAAGAPSGRFDGVYSGIIASTHRAPAVRVEVVGGRGSGSCGSSGTITLAITSNGDLSGQLSSCGPLWNTPIEGRADGRQLVLGPSRSDTRGDRVVLTRESAAVPSAGAFDGTYTGDHNLGGAGGSASRATVVLKVVNGNGSGTINSPGCSPSPFSVSIASRGDVSGRGDLNCILGGVANIRGLLSVSGHYDDRSLRLMFVSERGGRWGMVLTRTGN